MPSATVTSARTPAGVGPLLREWRQQRHLSQLDLAGTAEVSTKHLSFVETGRSKPSRELVLHLGSRVGEHLKACTKIGAACCRSLRVATAGTGPGPNGWRSS